MRLLTPSGVNDSSFIVSIENVETKVSHASNDPPLQTSSSRWQKAKKVDVLCVLRIRFPNNCNDASSANWISSIKSTVGFEWDEMTRISSPSMYLILSAESTLHAYELNSIQLDGMSLLRRGTTSRSIDWRPIALINSSSIIFNSDCNESMNIFSHKAPNRFEMVANGLRLIWFCSNFADRKYPSDWFVSSWRCMRSFVFPTPELPETITPLMELSLRWRLYNSPSLSSSASRPYNLSGNSNFGGTVLTRILSRKHDGLFTMSCRSALRSANDAYAPSSHNNPYLHSRRFLTSTHNDQGTPNDSRLAMETSSSDLADRQWAFLRGWSISASSLSCKELIKLVWMLWTLSSIALVENNS